MSEKNDTLVQVEHLKKYFPIKGVKGPGVQAVEDISIEIKRGETLGLLLFPDLPDVSRSTRNHLLLHLFRQTI